MTFSWSGLAAWAALATFASLLLRKGRTTPAIFTAACLPPLLACLEVSGLLSSLIRFDYPLLTGTGMLVVWLWRNRRQSSPQQDNGASVVLALCLTGGSLAASGVSVHVPSNELNVAVAFDRSRSAELTPAIQRRLDLEWKLLRRSMGPEHRVSVIDFATSAHLTSGPQPVDQLRLLSPPALPAGATNLEAAIRAGLAVLPSNGSGRLVLVTDGRATRGSVEAGLLAAQRQNVPVDIVPLERPRLPNLRVDRIMGPLVVRSGEAFDLRVVFESPVPMEAGFELLANGETIDRGHLSLRGGQDVVRFGLQAGDTNLTRYAVRCWATQRSQDQIQDDNEGATFVQVLGRSSALVVSLSAVPPISDLLVHGDFMVTTTTPERAPQSVQAWAAYDIIVVEGLPAEHFLTEQLVSLATAVEHSGTGLLLLGSADGLGPGGYGFSALERISPVSFDVAHERRRGRVDLALLVDASASMAARVENHLKLDLAHHAVLATAAALAPDDRLGIAHVNRHLTWTLPLSVPPSPEQLKLMLQAAEPLGAGIRADVALRQTYPTLLTSDAHVKHVVVLVDADDVEGATRSFQLARDAAKTGITTSVVSLGIGQNASESKQLAQAGKGRHFAVVDPERLPAVLVRELLAASHNPVRDVLIQVNAEPTSVTQGIDFKSAPTLGGYVTTLPKPRAKLHLRSPDSSPILASWSIGLGQMAVFTSDYGWHWGSAWANWSGAAQLMLQTARLVARPTATSGVLARAVPSEGRLQVSVDVLGGPAPERGPFSARVVTPDGSIRDTALLDRGSGRFASELPLDSSGTYLVSVTNQRSGKINATTGVEVGVHDELSSEGTDVTSLSAPLLQFIRDHSISGGR